MVLLEHLAEAGADFRYVPIDISEKAMRSVIEATRKRLPELERFSLYMMDELNIG